MYKQYELIEFHDGDYYENGIDRETILYNDIEPKVKLEAQKIMNEVSKLIKFPFVTGVEVLPDWKRFNLCFVTNNGLKGKRHFRCVEVKDEMV